MTVLCAHRTAFYVTVKRQSIIIKSNGDQGCGRETACSRWDRDESSVRRLCHTAFTSIVVDRELFIVCGRRFCRCVIVSYEMSMEDGGMHVFRCFETVKSDDAHKKRTNVFCIPPGWNFNTDSSTFYGRVNVREV